jgi:hypothetical protein
LKPGTKTQWEAIYTIAKSLDPRIPAACLPMLQSSYTAVQRNAARAIGSRWWQIPQDQLSTCVQALKMNLRSKDEQLVNMTRRAIGLLSKADSNVMCAQCHVEYACNPGFDPKTGAAIGMEDRRTNYFPWVNALDVQKRYTEVGFKDFKHGVTGALLTKLQHPEVETFWGSKHERAGVECKDCHMPKVKDKKGKILYLPRTEECPLYAEGHLRPMPYVLVSRRSRISGGRHSELHPRKDEKGRVLAGTVH